MSTQINHRLFDHPNSRFFVPGTLEKARASDVLPPSLTRSTLPQIGPTLRLQPAPFLYEDKSGLKLLNQPLLRDLGLCVAPEQNLLVMRVKAQNLESEQYGELVQFFVTHFQQFQYLLHTPRGARKRAGFVAERLKQHPYMQSMIMRYCFDLGGAPLLAKHFGALINHCLGMRKAYDVWTGRSRVTQKKTDVRNVGRPVAVRQEAELRAADGHSESARQTPEWDADNKVNADTSVAGGA